jgi:hypothetical protein
VEIISTSRSKSDAVPAKAMGLTFPIKSLKLECLQAYLIELESVFIVGPLFKGTCEGGLI